MFQLNPNFFDHTGATEPLTTPLHHVYGMGLVGMLLAGKLDVCDLCVHGLLQSQLRVTYLQCNPWVVADSHCYTLGRARTN